MSMPPPLQGITVVDFSHVMAGPFCTHTLKTLGARVIKIERAGEGDVMRHYDTREEYKGTAPPFIAVNCGKESIALDLKSEAGLGIAKQLLEKADVVVENFRPGVLDRLGLGYHENKATNPGVIYCSVSGFGKSGPMRDNPAYDHVVQAVSGVMSLTGEPGSKPTKVGFPVLDTFAGYTAASAIVSAVLQRERFGEGQYIDVAMLDASLNLMIAMVAPYLIAGDIPKKVGNRGFNMSPTSDTFQAADSEISIGANTQVQYEALCKALDREDLIHDPRFAEREGRIKNEIALRDEIESRTREKPAEEWEIIFNKVSVPSAAVRTINDIANHPHVEQRPLKVSIDLPHNPLAKTLGPGFQLANVPPESLGAAPQLGEHTRALLIELGYTNDSIDTLTEQGAIQVGQSGT
ncbi:CaiB/BaiF CoA transferase family protein [Aurantivibrio plasticivorans]